MSKLQRFLALAALVIFPLVGRAAPSGTTDLAGNAIQTAGLTPSGAWETYILVIAPTVTTDSASSVASTSVTLGGNVTADGAATVTERGIVYSTSNTTPTTSDTKIAIGSGTGTFSQSVTGLAASTTYYVRAYAINSAGTSYGSAITVTTLPPAPVISSGATASGTYGSSAFSYTIAASGNPTSFSASTLPPGLSLNTSTGAITGTPTDATGSPYSVTIGATNAGGTGTATLTITIARRTLVVLASSQFSAAAKVYDGTAVVTNLTKPGTVAFSGKFGTDDVSVDPTNAVGTFASKDVGSRSATISGLALAGTAAGNYTLSVLGSTPAVVISAKPLTISGLSGTSRVYDGSNVASLTGTAALQSAITAGSGNSSDGKPYDVDNVSLGGTPTATFDTKDVGTTKSITVSGYTVTGTGAGNYQITQPTGLTADVTAKAVTISGLSAASSRVYDGSPTMPLTGTPGLLATEDPGTGDANDGKPYNVDNISVTGTPAGAFATKDVGTNKAINVSGLSLTGTGHANYSVGATSFTADVTAKTLTVTGVIASDKTYDGDATATLVTGSATLVGVVDGDSVTLAAGSASGTFDDKNVGTTKTVTVAGLSLASTDAANYALTQPTTTAAIKAKALTVSGVTANSKTYDGNATAALDTTSAALVGVIGAETVTLSTGSATGTFDNKNVGLAKTVTVANLSIGSTGDAANYTLTQPTTTAAITAKALSVSGVTASSKTYDGNATATVNASSAALVGVVNGETVTLSTGSATGTFDDKNVGTAKTVTVANLSIGSTGDAANYTLTQPTTTANVTVKALTVSGVTASDKTYDGNTTATLVTSSAALVGLVNGDSVTLATGGATGTFDNKNIGTNKTVTVASLSIGSTGDALNYTLTQPTTTAAITAKALTVSGVTASSKTYDGNANATVNPGSAALVGVVGGETVTLNTASATGTFDDKNAGTNKTVTVANLSIGSTGDAANYTLTQPTTTADITAKTLTVSGVTASDKTYDGNATATLVTSSAALVGVVGSDSVTLATGSATGTFDNKNVGQDKTVTVANLSIGSTGDAANYTVTQPTTTAAITAKGLTVSGVIASAKVYDGTPVATLGAGSATLVGVVSGDSVSLDSSAASGAFADRHVGIGKTVTVSGLALAASGDAANYTLAQPADVTGNITPKALTSSGLTASSKIYDGTTAATLSGTAVLAAAQAAGAGTTSDGKPYSLDTVSIEGTASGAFPDRHVGDAKAVSVSGLTLGGAHASNYTLTQPTGLTSGITRKTLTIAGLSATNRIYDATTSAPLAGTAALQAASSPGSGTTSDGKPYSGDAVALDGTPVATFADRDVGDAKPVALAGLALINADATNYTLALPTDLTAKISPKALTVSGVTASDKIYDASTVAALTGTPVLQTDEAAGAGATSDGKPYTGDTVSLTGTMSGAFADRDAAAGKTVTVTGLSLEGAQAANYVVGPLTATATITPKALTISGVTASDRIYDATIVAPLGGIAAIAAPQAVGTGTTDDGVPYAIDEVNLSGAATGAFADRNAGHAKSITVTGLTLSGAQAANYTPTQPGGLTASVTPKALGVLGLAAVDRIYDGTTVAPLNGTAALLDAAAPGSGTADDGKPYTGDTVTLDGTAAGAFADRHVAAGKTVTVSGLSLAGAQAANYSVTQPVGLTADVSVKTLTASGLAGVDRTYDGTTVAPLTGTVVLQSAIVPGTGTTGDGKPYTGDTVTLSGAASGVFADRHVGSGKAITVSGVLLGGAEGGNYALVQPTGLTGGVTPKALTIVGVTASDRVYDATTTAPLAGTAALSAAQAPGAGTASDGKPYTGDAVALAGTAAATFADKLVGSGKPVTVTGLSLDGAQAANYTLTPLTGLTAAVAAKELTVTGVTANNKTYDASSTATLVLANAALVGVAGADDVTLVTSGASGAFVDSNAGTKNVNVSGLALTGTDAGNYTLTQPVATASIAPASITISFANLSHVYDGTTKQATVTSSPSVSLAITYSASPINAGSYTVTASSSDSNHTGSNNATLTIAKATQTVAFAAPGSASPGTPIALSATASSGLPVTFSVLSGSGSISGSTLTLNSGAVTVRATQAGDANYQPASADQTIGSASKLPQTIAFASISNHNATDPAFPLSATASSGLPVSFAIVSGPATVSGNTLTLTGAPGAVVVRASQAGDATFEAAPDVTQAFNVIAVGHQVFFGITQNDDTVAIDVAADGQSGTLLCYIGATGEAFIVTFTINADGTFDAEVVALGGGIAVSSRSIDGRVVAAASPTRTFRGRLSGGTITGSIVELGITFSAQIQPSTGPTADIAGLYQSKAINSSAGTTASIVGSEGQVLVVASTATITTGATGAVLTDGTFTAQAPGATITGSVDAPTTTVSGTILIPNQPPVPFSGLSSTTIRTDRLINLSSRARIGPAAGRTLITGFVIGGVDAKNVLLRAVGPALGGFGVDGAISNPRLQLYDSNGRVILENDDWSGADTSAAFTRVGAFSIAPGARDAALLTRLEPGAYTMHVMDGGDTGVALAEIYDASVNPQGEYQRLVNISSRGTVEGGEGVLIGGFIVTGNSPKKILVRGVGPALGGFGVTGALANPRLTVFSGSNAIAMNDDWAVPTPVSAGQAVATSAEIIAAGQATGAFAFGSSAKDAALILTLAPGPYTAQVSAADSTSTGVALVEIYELPE